MPTTRSPNHDTHRFPVFVALLLCALAAPAASAADAASFEACISDLKLRAEREGIDAAVAGRVLDSVSPVERVIELDRSQPEFTRTFADYYLKRVTEERVVRGRELLGTHRGLLQAVQDRYGIPAQYLVAFWGLETNFGSYFGKLPVADSLATLACDQRRSAFFSDELMAAMRMIERGDATLERLEGSWAGAMGHMQFLPSAFLRHAVDGDGDGRRDLWDSLPDVMHSAGNFLRALGWQSGLRWGREVRLPENFDYALAGRDRPRPLSYWVSLGMTDAYGGALPALDLPAAILVPAGHDGPAFVAYENFDVIMRWNRSEYYALAVGRLADRIAGAGRLVRAPDLNEPPVSFDDVRRLQADLVKLGYDPGEIDGIFGANTRRALSRFQKERRLVADGHLDVESLAAVRAATGRSDP